MPKTVIFDMVAVKFAWDDLAQSANSFWVAPGDDRYMLFELCTHDHGVFGLQKLWKLVGYGLSLDVMRSVLSRAVECEIGDLRFASDNATPPETYIRRVRRFLSSAIDAETAFLAGLKANLKGIVNGKVVEISPLSNAEHAALLFARPDWMLQARHHVDGPFDLNEPFVQFAERQRECLSAEPVMAAHSTW